MISHFKGIDNRRNAHDWPVLKINLLPFFLNTAINTSFIRINITVLIYRNLILLVIQQHLVKDLDSLRT